MIKPERQSYRHYSRQYTRRMRESGKCKVAVYLTLEARAQLRIDAKAAGRTLQQHAVFLLTGGVEPKPELKLNPVVDVPEIKRRLALGQGPTAIARAINEGRDKERQISRALIAMIRDRKVWKNIAAQEPSCKS